MTGTAAITTNTTITMERKLAILFTPKRSTVQDLSGKQSEMAEQQSPDRRNGLHQF